MADWLAMLKAQRLDVALVQQCQAVKRLRPDLLEKLRDGTLEICDTRADVYLEFAKRVMAAAGVSNS